MLRTLARALLVVTVAGTGAVPASAADPGPLEAVCGVDVHVDELLGCIQAMSQAGPAQALEVRPPAATPTRPRFDRERILSASSEVPTSAERRRSFAGRACSSSAG